MRVSGSLSVVAFVLALACGLVAAEEVTLIELGRFDRVFEAAEGFGVETHLVRLDQRETETLVDLGTLPGLCAANRNLLDACVHEIRIELTTTRPYGNLFLVYQRAGSEVDEILFDDHKVGAVSVGSFVVTDGAFADVSFGLGMVTPRKTHTIVLRSPEYPPGTGFHLVGGIKVIGVPVGGSNWHPYRTICRAGR